MSGRHVAAGSGESGLRLNATAVKLFFQYGCERQVRYLMMDKRALETIVLREPPAQAGPWADAANDFERRVIDEVAAAADGQLLRPPPGEKYLQQAESAAFLRQEGQLQLAHQLQLRPTPGDHFHVELAVPPGVAIGQAYLDLVKVLPGDDGRPATIRVCDVKFTRAATPFHKIQVAYYALLMESALRDLGSPLAVDPMGEILHQADPAVGGLYAVEPFPLRGYRAQVTDFFRREVRRLAGVRVDAGRDDTFFHHYFKCEQCEFLRHCAAAIDPARPPGDWDVSAVPGLSQQSKRTLVSLGVRTVGDLAVANDLSSRAELNWSLRTHADALVRRAGALARGAVERVPERYTHLMPPRVDVAIYLAVDHDPVEGRLASIGCLCERSGPADEARSFTVAPVAEAGPDAERAAIVDVLEAALAELAAVDAHNAARRDDPWFAHVYLYEPSEAADLQRALGRHLASADVRGGLLRAVQMFPPDDFLPEPEYRGVSHLPATALRRVVEELYAVPARVSYDLAAVSRAMAAAQPPLADPYVPADPFGGAFSSRLNIDCCRDLKAGGLSVDAVAADVRARLVAMAAVARWVRRDNADAVADGRPAFLRLNKAPFRFQRTFDPLDAAELDVLRAQEVLHSRSDQLKRLTELARTADERVRRFECFGRLRLVDDAGLRARRRLQFRVPPESRDAELDESTFGVVLTDGDPDLLLDPAAWRQVEVRIEAVADDGSTVTVRVGDRVWDGPRFKAMLARNAGGEWFLDRVHVDINGPRTERFLRFLGTGEARA